MGIVKEKKHSRIVYRQLFTQRDLLLEAYSVRTMTGRILINHGNGNFVDRDNPRYSQTLDQVYQQAKTVKNWQGTLLARIPEGLNQTALRRVSVC